MTIKQEIIKLTNINKQLKRNYNSNKKKIKSLETNQILRKRNSQSRL